MHVVIIPQYVMALISFPEPFGQHQRHGALEKFNFKAHACLGLQPTSRDTVYVDGFFSFPAHNIECLCGSPGN